MSGAGVPDFFYKEALRLGYVARSAFKLLQLQEKYKLIKPGSSVLDLGCAPGAWLQVACQSLGPPKNGGVVVGIDLKKVRVPSTHCDARVQTVWADVLNLPRDHIRSLSPKKGFSVILSDMCPPVSGIKTKDAALSAELGMRALDLAVGRAALAQEDVEPEMKEEDDNSLSEDDKGILLSGGNLVIKLLESEEMKVLTYAYRIHSDLQAALQKVIMVKTQGYKIIFTRNIFDLSRTASMNRKYDTLVCKS